MKILPKGTYLGCQTDHLNYGQMIFSKTEYRLKENQSWHRHENSFFAYFLKGGNRELRKSKEFTCNPGTLLFYKPQEYHCNKDYSFGCRIFHVEIDNAWFDKHDVKPENIHSSQIDDHLAKNIFLNMIREFNIRDELSQSSMQALVIYVLNLLGRQSVAGKQIPLWKYHVEELIREEPCSNHSLTEIAKKLNIHPVTLSREFPKYFHSTFGSYIRRQRIEKALLLLARKSIPISEIADSCGFSDSGNFSRSFKKLRGITPDAYRKLI